MTSASSSTSVRKLRPRIDSNQRQILSVSCGISFRRCVLIKPRPRRIFSPRKPSSKCPQAAVSAHRSSSHPPPFFFVLRRGEPSPMPLTLSSSMPSSWASPKSRVRLFPAVIREHRARPDLTGVAVALTEQLYLPWTNATTPPSPSSSPPRSARRRRFPEPGGSPERRIDPRPRPRRRPLRLR